MFIPKTTLGKRSLQLIAFFFGLMLVFNLLVRSGQRGGETFFSNIPLAGSVLSAAFCAISAFFIGLISIIKFKERSPFVFLAVILGLFVLIFCLGEVIYPH